MITMKEVIYTTHVRTKACGATHDTPLLCNHTDVGVSRKGSIQLEYSFVEVKMDVILINV